MDLILKDFQEETVSKLISEARFARDGIARADRPQAIVLSAPTGSGKTVMLIGTMEALLAGNEDIEPDPEATFLWVSDQPDLNEQTRRKVQEQSSVFGPDSLVTVDASFDADEFKPGNIYFLNIQKLREGGVLVSEGDERNFTIWETISNTVAARPSSFWLVLDEAHRGMQQQSKAEVAVAQSIVQKFILGAEGQLPPVPLILGLSATPDRFRDLLSDVNRLQRDVVVPIPEVIASGLIKEAVLIKHPKSAAAADVTLLRQAAQELMVFENEWQTYRDTGGERLVRPVLLVQVEDGPEGKLTSTDLPEALSALEDELGPLSDLQVGHCFQEHVDVLIGDRRVRYVSPPDVQADSDLRVVFFKMALNTGWDCPRAEVMMSFRKAVDDVYIAQLIGRMVRAPLAHRIESNEVLNTVSVYLPHYNEAALTEVVGRLQRADLDVLPPTSIEVGSESIILRRSEERAESFDALTGLPTYIVPTTRKTPALRRLMKFARYLANDEVLFDAINTAKAKILDELNAARVKQSGSDRFQTLVKDSGTLDLRSVEVKWGREGQNEQFQVVEVTDENVEDLFKAAARKVGEGIEKLYRRARAQEDPSTARRIAKLEFFALVTDGEVMRRLESVAEDLIQEWTRSHRLAIEALSPDRREPYRQVWQTASDPVEITMSSMPDSIRGKRQGNNWDNHLYVDDDEKLPSKFNTWETKTLEEEQDRDDHVAFLRNEDRKAWALRIPWTSREGGRKPVYPDFITFRRVGDQIVVGVLDPHNPDLEDSWRKAIGMAEYVQEHHLLLECFDLIVVDGERVIHLDLTDAQTRTRVLGITDNDQLQALFS